jgi:hypothetical protein
LFREAKELHLAPSEPLNTTLIYSEAFLSTGFSVFWIFHTHTQRSRHIIERDSELMFSPSPPYTEILPVRAMLASFAVQTVTEKMVHEAEAAVHSESRLHVSLFGQHGRTKALGWTDVGTATLNNTSDII